MSNFYPMSALNYQENKFLLAGPAGDLEIVCEVAEQSSHDIAAIICHPHPLFGGTLHNKVVTTLAKAYKDLGFKHIIRFNFRGVGQSTGDYAKGVGEQDDLLAVVDWVRQRTQTIWLAGFSFGSYIAAASAKAVGCKQLTCIAPAVGNFDFTAIPPFTCPWLVVQGEQDEVVAAQQVYQWLEQLNHQPKLVRMPQASHFFHGQLLELRAQLVQELNNYL